MARKGKLEGRRFQRIVRVVDGVNVRCAVVPIYTLDGIRKTSKERRLKINSLMAQRQYYRRKLNGKIKQVDRLIEQIEMQL